MWNNPPLNTPNVYKFDMSLNKAFNEYMTPFLKDKKEEFKGKEIETRLQYILIQIIVLLHCIVSSRIVLY